MLAWRIDFGLCSYRILSMATSTHDLTNLDRIGISPVVQVLSKPCYLAQFLFWNASTPNVQDLSVLIPGKFSMGFVARWRSPYPAARRVFIQLCHNRTLISPLDPSPIRQMYQQTWRQSSALAFPSPSPMQIIYICPRRCVYRNFPCGHAVQT
jgi:hypothetical protein